MLFYSIYSISFGIVAIVLSSMILKNIFIDEDILEKHFFINWNKSPIISFLKVTPFEDCPKEYPESLFNYNFPPTVVFIY